NLTIHKHMLMDDRPVPLDETVIASIEKTCDDMGVAYRKMPSGAGHDAMNMATICPTGLIFIPCRDGLSHHKEEYADIKDILIGCDVLEKELIKWARAEDNMVRHTNGRYIS